MLNAIGIVKYYILSVRFIRKRKKPYKKCLFARDLFETHLLRFARPINKNL